MKWLYNHPRFYDLLDSLVSFKLSDNARNYILKNLNSKVLEVGIGTAKSSFYSDHIDLFGIDINEKMLKIAKERKAKVSLANAHSLPFKDQSFNSILFLFSLPSEKPKETLEEALRIGKRVCILEYKPLSKFFEWFGEKVFDSPNLRLTQVLKGFNFSHQRYENLFDIYYIGK